MGLQSLSLPYYHAVAMIVRLLAWTIAKARARSHVYLRVRIVARMVVKCHVWVSVREAATQHVQGVVMILVPHLVWKIVKILVGIHAKNLVGVIVLMGAITVVTLNA